RLHVQNVLLRTQFRCEFHPRRSPIRAGWSFDVRGFQFERERALLRLLHFQRIDYGISVGGLPAWQIVGVCSGRAEYGLPAEEVLGTLCCRYLESESTLDAQLRP